MTAKTEFSTPKRRTRAEVQKLVSEFVSSGMPRSEFCQGRGLSFSTLDRHLKKRRWDSRRRPVSSAGRLVPVELAAKKSATQQAPSCGLAVVLPGGGRLGLEISRATLDGWVLKVGELLIPTVAAMRRELVTGSYIQADETPVDVQTREGRRLNCRTIKLTEHAITIPTYEHRSVRIVLPSLADIRENCSQRDNLGLIREIENTIDSHFRSVFCCGQSDNSWQNA